MRFEAVTIKDIAKALGLSASTVSRALRDSYEISTETKKLVTEYAAKINYQPNPIAQSLKVRKSRTIGLMVSEVANPFFSQMINGVDTLAQDRGYNVIITQSHEKFDVEQSSLKFLTSRSVDGIIVSVSLETENVNYFKELHERGMPIVFFDRVVKDMDTHKVILNNYKGAYDATVYLIRHGYKKIAALASVGFLSITQDRLAGFTAAHTDKNRPCDPENIYNCKPGHQLEKEIENAADYFLNMKNRPDAVIGLSDKLTTGLLKEFTKRRIKVPDDIALIGFSNSDLTELFNPPLSIIKQPAFEMGKVACELLLDLIESKRPVTQYTTRMLEPEVIIRKSVQRGPA